MTETNVEESSNSNKSTKTKEETNNQEEETAPDENEEPSQPLIYSSHLNGYLTILISSLINFHSVWEVSPDENCFKYVPKSYPATVGLVSAITTGIIIFIHLDQCTRMKQVWDKAFAPKSPIEFCLILFLVIWWFVATGINTNIKGT